MRTTRSCGCRHRERETAELVYLYVKAPTHARASSNNTQKGTYLKVVLRGVVRLRAVVVNRGALVDVVAEQPSDTHTELGVGPVLENVFLRNEFAGDSHGTSVVRFLAMSTAHRRYLSASLPGAYEPPLEPAGPPAHEPGGSACCCWNRYGSSAATRLKDGTELVFNLQHRDVPAVRRKPRPDLLHHQRDPPARRMKRMSVRFSAASHSATR